MTTMDWNGRPTFLAFREFHEANPHVYDELRRLALDLKSRGRNQYGIMSLMNVVRWHRAMATTRDADDFKVNNNFAPYYARLLIRQEKKLAGFFVLRHSEADEVQ